MSPLINEGCIHLLNTRKYCDNTRKYWDNTHEYWPNTWKMWSPTSTIFTGIVTILVSFEAILYSFHVRINLKSKFKIKNLPRTLNTSKLLQNLQVLWQYSRILHLQVNTFFQCWVNTGEHYHNTYKYCYNTWAGEYTLNDFVRLCSNFLLTIPNFLLAFKNSFSN